MDLMIRLKELQRRMDQILGLPKMNVEVRERCKYTVSARLSRLEEQMSMLDHKLDDCINMLRMLPDIKTQIEFPTE